jgi:tetratricopeptide (TPR) repeat protein
LALELNWREAEAGFLHALSLGNQVTTYRQFALFLSAAQRFDEAWHYLQEAQQIDPFSVRQKVACAKFFHLSRRWDEGLAHFQSRPVFGPLPVETRLYVALMQIQSGQADEGRKATLAAQREAGGQPTLMSRIAENLALSGDLAAATRIVEDFKLPAPNSPLSRFRQALLALSLEQRDRGLSDLAQAVAEKEAECVWLAVEPRLDALRSEPEFEKFLTSVQAGFSS